MAAVGASLDWMASVTIGLRVAISRATTRGITVETVQGDGFVAVRKVDEPRTRKGKAAPSGEGQRRRGRPPKLQA
jgi:hypothetical protein